MGKLSAKEYFEENYRDYDAWYRAHPKEYSDQVDFLRNIIPAGRGVEIGVGTGRFASMLGIEYGVDRVRSMVDEASARGVRAFVADAESMPFEDGFFDYAFSIVTLCFLERPEKVLTEAKRVARAVITVILDRDTEYIRNIMKHRMGFYRYATFYNESELVEMYRKLSFRNISVSKKDLMTSEGESYRLVSVTGN